MLSSSRIEELRTKFDENPRRYFAPLANEYRKAGRIDDAIALCREQLARYPDHMSGHIVLGQSLYESRALDEAGRVFETAVALDGENLIALRHLGDIARERGELESARGWYGRVLDADPHHEDVAAQLAALGAGASGGQHGGQESAPDIELPSFAGALAAALDAPAAQSSTSGMRDGGDAPDAAGLAPWEPASLDDLITRSDDVIVLDAPAEDAGIVLSPSLLEPAPLLDGPSESIAGLEFDPVVGLDDPPTPLERAPLVGFDPTPAVSNAPLPPLDLHFDDFSAESLRSADTDPTPAAGTPANRWEDEPTDLDLPRLDDDAESAQTADAEARAPVDGAHDDGEFEEVALGAPAPAPRAAEALPPLADEPHDRSDDEHEPASSAPPAPSFVTETMAELYLQQGFTQQGLDVYRELAALRPSDDLLALRVAALEAQLASTAAATFAEPQPAPAAAADDAPWSAGDGGELVDPAATTGEPVGDTLAERAPSDVDDVERDAAPGGVAENGAPAIDATSEVASADDLPSAASAGVDGGSRPIDEAASAADHRDVRAESSAVADGAVEDEPVSEETPLSARAFFASLAVRRPTPAMDAMAVAPAGEPTTVSEAGGPDSATAAAAPTADVTSAQVTATEADDDDASPRGVSSHPEHDAGAISSRDASAAHDEPGVLAHDEPGVLAHEDAAPSAPPAEPDRDGVLEAACVDGAVELTAVAHVAELPMAATRPTLAALLAGSSPTSADEAAAQRLASAFGAGDDRAPALMADAERVEAQRRAAERTAAESAAAASRSAPAPSTPPSPAPTVWSEPRPATPAAPAAYSFDKFFADVPEADVPAPVASAPAAPTPVAPVGWSAPVAPPAAEEPRAPSRPESAPAAPAASGDDDIEQFNEWLRGLRDS